MSTQLHAGSKAPDFSIPDQTGKIRSLADYQGRWLLLYFYPRDFTPGCTTEACQFRDAFVELKQVATVVGVSTDSVERHRRFSEKHELPFTLLSDEQGAVVARYGTTGVIFKKRTSFLIDPSGTIRKVYAKVRPAEHALEVLADLRQFATKK